MPSIVPNRKIEDILRKLLNSEGYRLSKPKAYGETGTDIVAEKRGARHHIEVIAYKSSGPARAKDFFQAFFRAISRIKEGASSCAIAMPKEAGRGLLPETFTSKKSKKGVYYNPYFRIDYPDP